MSSSKLASNSSVSMVSPQQLLLTFVHSDERTTTATASSSDKLDIKKESSKRRTRVVWGASETRVLLEVWGPRYEDIKSGSIAIKKDLWRDISREFEHACEKNRLGTVTMSLDQLRKRVANLEYRYRQIKSQMAVSSEEEAIRLKASFPFYEALDKALDKSSNDPFNLAVGSPLAESFQDDFKPTVVELNLPLTQINTYAHDNDDIANGELQGMEKRKRSLETENDEPYFKRFCALWEESLERQERWFTRVVEMQERIIEKQAEQTKQIVEGLRSIMHEVIDRKH